MTHRFTESIVEYAALAWLADQGYTILHGPDIAPDEPAAERADYGQVILEGRLRQALQRLNPAAPADALDEVFRRLTKTHSPSLLANNHAVHRCLVEGVPVEHQRTDGSLRGDLVRVQTQSRAHLRELLRTASGGVIFTTVQKFFPLEGPGRGAAVAAQQYRRHRRRSAPQPV